MIRSFDWRDVRLVRTLSGQGVCLDAQTSLIRGHRPLQLALLDYFAPGLGAPTLVWRQAAQGAFAQTRYGPGFEQARVLFLAPAPDASTPGALAVLDEMAAAAGGRGAHNLIAEVEAASPASEALRAAGFAVYARQSLWQLAPGGARSLPSLPLNLRAAAPADQWAVSVLYGNIVPRLVQQVEPAPVHPRGFVLEQAGQLMAYLHVRRGPLGIWLEPFVHPEAEQLAEAVVLNGLGLLASPGAGPVYVCVRRYQDWWQTILQRAGLRLLGAQAVLVKRLTVRLPEAARQPLPAIDGQPSTTPLAHLRRRVWERRPVGPDGR